MAGAIASTAAGSDALTPAGKKAIWGAFFGFWVDFYDIYLPTVALTPALIYFIPKGLPVQTAATLNFLVFTVTLIGRPIGSFIFGHLGDVIGRKRTTIIAVSGFTVMTFLIALLPGYATWGYTAIALLIAFRLVDGLFFRVEESKRWETPAKDRVKAPLVDLFSGRNLRNLVQVFLLMTGLWFVVQVSITATPTFLQTVLKQPARGVTYGLLVANLFLSASF